MKKPNQACKEFCEFMLDRTIIKLTPAQTTVCEQIIEAVDLDQEVTDNTYRNFFKFSPQYYQQYNMHLRFWLEDSSWYYYSCS